MRFRILCDGEHDEGAVEEEEEVVDAVAEQEIAEPVHAPGPDAPPQIRPPF